MLEKNSKENGKQWAKIVAKCWQDPHFKERLLKNPSAALKQEGIALPNIHVEIHENTEKTLHLVIPQKPAKTLSEEDLYHYAGGGGEFCHCCWGA